MFTDLLQFAEMNAEVDPKDIEIVEMQELISTLHDTLQATLKPDHKVSVIDHRRGPQHVHSNRYHLEHLMQALGLALGDCSDEGELTLEHEPSYLRMKVGCKVTLTLNTLQCHEEPRLLLARALSSAEIQEDETEDIPLLRLRILKQLATRLQIEVNFAELGNARCRVTLIIPLRLEKQLAFEEAKNLTV